MFVFISKASSSSFKGLKSGRLYEIQDDFMESGNCIFIFRLCYSKKYVNKTVIVESVKRLDHQKILK